VVASRRDKHADFPRAFGIKQRLQTFLSPGHFPATMFCRLRIQNQSAGNGFSRRVRTNDKALIMQSYNRTLESQLREAAASRGKFAVIV
jgi:hypothetical protein